MDRERFEKFGAKVIYQAGRGCQKRNKSGYRGRHGHLRMLIVDDDIRQLILKNVDSSSVRTGRWKRACDSVGRRRPPQSRRVKRPCRGSLVTQEDL